MNYTKTTLPNGIRVITVPMPSLESVTVAIWTGVGSRYEEDKIAGLSHFLEHMVFKGSVKRPSARAISEAVDEIGGEFNAGTTKEWTNFYIKCRKDNLNTAFDVLSDMVLNPLLKEEDIQKEKGVILEEMAMYEDTPMVNINDVFEETMFGKTPLGRDTIGIRKAIEEAKKDDFVLYRKQYYYPENLVITVSGGVTDKMALDMAVKYFGGLSGSQNKQFKKWKSVQTKPQLKLKTKKVEQAHFILGFLGKPKGNPDRFTESVLAGILGGGMSSRLFSEIREKRGLAYSVRTSADHFVDTGYIGTYAGVDLKKIDEAIKVTLSEHYKIAGKNHGITPKELTKAKEYIKGHLALYLEDTKGVGGFFGDQEVLLGKVETPEEVFAGIDKVTLDDVVRVAKELFIPEKLNLAVIGPYNSEAEFEKLIK
ncbi:MAG TPA: pitrilysin family protein [Patescibacteria group bacterium]